MEINYLAVLVCAVLSMVVGSIWYGPLFGKKWAEIIGADMSDEIKRKQMQKEAASLYAVQFVLSLLQLYILAHFVQGWTEVSGIENALWLWLGFILPTIAGGVMWNNNPNKVKWSMFLIQAGYQLIMFIIYGLILSTWL